MKLASVEVLQFGNNNPVQHAYACPRCQQRPAVCHVDTGVFQPCWACQSVGWRLVKLPKWTWRWLAR